MILRAGFCFYILYVFQRPSVRLAGALGAAQKPMNTAVLFISCALISDFLCGSGVFATIDHLSGSAKMHGWRVLCTAIFIFYCFLFQSSVAFINRYIGRLQTTPMYLCVTCAPSCLEYCYPSFHRGRAQLFPFGSTSRVCCKHGISLESRSFFRHP